MILAAKVDVDNGKQTYLGVPGLPIHTKPTGLWPDPKKNAPAHRGRTIRNPGQVTGL